MKRCTRCATEKPVSEFHKKQSRCKPCAVTVATEWNRQHKERRKVIANGFAKQHQVEYAERTRQWRVNNRDRHLWQHRGYAHKRRAWSTEAGPVITLEQWQWLLAVYGNKCLACGSTDAKLTVDHIVPLSKWGSNGITNIQPLCLSCNDRKRAKTHDYRPFLPEVWYVPDAA